MKWLIGLALGGIVGFFVWKKYKDSETSENITEGLRNEVPEGPRPEVSPGTPSPTLCEGITTVAGVAVATYYGAPPQLSIPLATAGSRPVCKMLNKAAPAALAAGKQAANFVGSSVKGIAYEAPLAGLYATKDQLSSSYTKSIELAKAIKSGSPTAVGKAGVDLTVQTITAPIKIVGSSLKKADPRKWF